MMYPDTLPIKVLQSEHPSYSDRKNILEDISLLSEGGYRLKRELQKYIKVRPGEHPAVYQARLDKFSYTNILASAITSQVGKLSKGSLTLANPLEKVEEHRKRLDEMQTLSRVFEELLKYQYCWVHVDKPYSEALTVAQEELLGLHPYINLYSASEVINWGENWIKIRRLQQIDNPFLESPQYVTEWIFIDTEAIATYSVDMKEKNGELTFATKEASLVSVKSHVTPGRLPLVKFEVPSNLWVANQALSLAVEHLKTSCHKHDLETFMYPQRQWNPQLKQNNDGFPMVEDEDSFPKTGLEFMMRGEFQWVEPTGAILPHLEKSLKHTEQQLRGIVALGVTAYSPSNDSSGVSKAYDESDQEEVLTTYGQILKRSWQEVLSLVSGLPVELLGFDSFTSLTSTRPVEVINLLSQPDLKVNLTANVGSEIAEKLLNQLI